MAAMSAVSCSKQLQDVPSGSESAGKVELLIPADETTKTVFGDGYEVKWNDTDKIGVFVGTSANVQASLTRIGGKAYFTAFVDADAAGKELYAYYPYDANAGKTPDKVTLKIPYQQKQSAPDVFNGSYNPMAAVPSVLNGTKTEDAITAEPLKFRHIGSILEFDITNIPVGETLKSVQFIAQTGYPATDNSSYNLISVTEDGDITAVPGTYYKSVTVALSGVQPGQSSKVYMTLIPGTYSGNIYISTDKSLYRFSEKTIEATRAEVKTIKVDLSSGRADNGKEIKYALDYEAFANAANAGDYSAWVDSEGEVKLGADITSATYFTRIQKDWDGKFNGQGKTITQKATIVPLFTVIKEGAYVKNLVLEGKKTTLANAGLYGNAAVAQVNYGTIEKIENRIASTVNVSAAAISGIVKCNAGLVKDCIQKGAITVNGQTSASTDALYAGGIACFASDSDDYSKATKYGRFENCTNEAAIKVTKKSDKAVSYSQHCVGGICAIVHNGSKTAFSEFKGCHNKGNISTVDDPSSKVTNGASAVGGIVGRIGNYSTQHSTKLAFDIAEGKGFYAKVEDCHNSGTVENGVLSTAQVISDDRQSGARTACAGGIAGYANGLKDAPVEILNCINDGQVKGGYSVNCVLGGICGETNNVSISGCMVTAQFNDSETAAHKLSAAGGLVGVSLLALTVKDCFVDMSGTLTSSPVGIGVLQGYVKLGTAEYSNIQVKASVSYGSGESLKIESDADLSEGKYYVVKPGTEKDPITAEASDITYWNKLK